MLRQAEEEAADEKGQAGEAADVPTGATGENKIESTS